MDAHILFKDDFLMRSCHFFITILSSYTIIEEVSGSPKECGSKNRCLNRRQLAGKPEVILPDGGISALSGLQETIQIIQP